MSDGDESLEMKLIEAEYTFDMTKLTFYFTADGRIDFRELVKDLAAYFHTRIELRQIGVRDEAKMLGGIGICGQPYCCKQFLNDFQTVSIKMAKEQGLSLNPTKVSGSCGRLMCCLKYEQDAYEYLHTLTPSVGATVKTSEGLATVTDVNYITGNLIVKLIENEGIPFKIHRDKVKVVSRSNKPKSPNFDL
jgi:cell fate regulator YaaT (PSP1 superfamily)